MKIKKIWIIPTSMMLVITVLIAGCTSNNTNYPPQIEITQPQNGVTIDSNDVTIQVSVSYFNLVNKLGSSNVAGEGHIHYFKDVTAPTTPNQPAVTAAGTYVATVDTLYTWTNVEGGMHTFSVELVNNDHTPLDPPVVKTVMVTVENTSTGSPTLTIVQPTQGASLNAGNITVSIDVSNFMLVNKLGQANVAKEGHVHYFLDVTPPTTPGQPATTEPGTYIPTINTSYTWMNVPAGTHTFSVELVNNDHTPLQPPITASVTVNLINSPGGGVTNIYLEAKNIHFNLSSIIVPAGAEVNIHFTNSDSGIPHNFALYTDSSATTALFNGDIIYGISSTTYSFIAPLVPGTYYFRCNIHPSQMYGDFIVV